MTGVKVDSVGFILQPIGYVLSLFSNEVGCEGLVDGGFGAFLSLARPLLGRVFVALGGGKPEKPTIRSVKCVL